MQIIIDFKNDVCSRIVFLRLIPQVKFRQLRGKVVQFFPFRAGFAGLRQNSLRRGELSHVG